MSPIGPTTRLAAVARRIDELAVERDALILALRAEGMTLRAIASHAGMTHVGVMRVIQRAEAAVNG